MNYVNDQTSHWAASIALGLLLSTHRANDVPIKDLQNKHTHSGQCT